MTAGCARAARSAVSPLFTAAVNNAKNCAGVSDALDDESELELDAALVDEVDDADDVDDAGAAVDDELPPQSSARPSTPINAITTPTAITAARCRRTNSTTTHPRRTLCPPVDHPPVDATRATCSRHCRTRPI